RLVGTLEPAGAIPQRQLLRHHRLSLAAAAVVDPHRVQEVGDLPAVRADVLDRRRPDAAGDARHASEPTEAGLDGPGHERVPVLARGNLDAHPLDTVDLRPLDPLALRADPDGEIGRAHA